MLRLNRITWPTSDQRLRHPKPHERRALILLAGCGAAGCTEAVMRMHGFTVEQLSELVRGGFAVPTSGLQGEAGKFTITEAGQRAMARPRGARDDGYSCRLNDRTGGLKLFEKEPRQAILGATAGSATCSLTTLMFDDKQVQADQFSAG